MQNIQTKATAKYQAKIGLVARSYKLKKTVADEFKEACKIAGDTQAAVLTRFMIEYTEAVKHRNDFIDKSKTADDEMKFNNDDIISKMKVRCRDCGSQIIINSYDLPQKNKTKPAIRCKKCDSVYIINIR